MPDSARCAHAKVRWDTTDDKRYHFHQYGRAHAGRRNLSSALRRQTNSWRVGRSTLSARPFDCVPIAPGHVAAPNQRNDDASGRRSSRKPSNDRNRARRDETNGDHRSKRLIIVRQGNDGRVAVRRMCASAYSTARDGGLRRHRRVFMSSAASAAIASASCGRSCDGVKYSQNEAMMGEEMKCRWVAQAARAR